MKAIAESALIFIFGALFGGAITAHVLTNQVQARNAALRQTVTDAVDQTVAQSRTNAELAQKVIDTWRGRTQSCEAKFSIATVIYQDQPIASVPFLRGIVAVQVAPGAGSAKPSLIIPAQVDVYSQRADIQYQWLDGTTGESKSAIQPAKASVQQ